MKHLLFTHLNESVFSFLHILTEPSSPPDKNVLLFTFNSTVTARKCALICVVHFPFSQFHILIKPLQYPALINPLSNSQTLYTALCIFLLSSSHCKS